MLRLILIVGLVASLYGCAAMKPIARTILDAATVLCELAAVENAAELRGMSPAEWCAIWENVVPFIDPLLAAKRRGAVKAGLNNVGNLNGP